MSGAIRSVAVAGTGVVAWTAAAGLLRALRKRELAVTVIDTGPDDAHAGFWTLPSQRGMHGLLGINESDFIAKTGSTFRLGSEHSGWQGGRSRYLHVHGEIGTELSGTPFYKHLQAEAVRGRVTPPDDWSLAAAAARLARFARPQGADLTASFTYGFHIEAARYASYLRAHAEKLGVCVTASPLAQVEMNAAGRIGGLRLADGSRVEADLYLDCSGSQARLLGSMSPEREDWSRWLPCDRMVSLVAGNPDPAPVTRTVAIDAGWTWRAPLAANSMAGVVYSSAHLGDDAAAAMLAGSASADEPFRTNISSGRRLQFWVGNCLGIGAAVVELEPLAGAHLHFAQLGLATLVELFPLDRDSVIESAEYNRLMREHADALRDFTLAHYHAGEPRQGAFWQALRSVELPDRLAHKLDLYSANGRITLLDHETFEETDWAWLLIGSGRVPAAVELQVTEMLAKTSPRELDALRMRIHQLAASMPPHAEFVRRQATPTART